MKILLEFRGWRLAFDRAPEPPADSGPGHATSYPVQVNDDEGELRVSFGFSPPEANSS